MPFSYLKRTNSMLTTTTASLLMVVITLGLVSLVKPQSVAVSEPRVFTDSDYGPVVYVGCAVLFPRNSINVQISWIYLDRVLTINGELEEGESPKYASGYHDGEYTLDIRNAVKEDAGSYRCQLVYKTYDYRLGKYNTYTYLKNVNIVNIGSYLPALNYPECSIAPSTTLAQGTEATFNCTVGESVPGVNLNLLLRTSDGTIYKWLGGKTLKRVVTFDDHDTRFICVMTSDTFPTARRTCSVGINVPFGLEYWTFYDTSFGLRIIVHCRYLFSAVSTGHKLRWTFNGTVMAENNTLNADTSRHSVYYYRSSSNEFTYSELIIQNAVKEDEGDYQCQAEYVQSGMTQQEIIQITIPIDSYLPALNYPECSIAPSMNGISETIFYKGTEATFNCTVGESVPNVNLQLIIQRSDGTTKELGNATVTKTITMGDNNAIFYCFMTSDTFLTVNRSCAAEPITVLPQPTTSAPTTDLPASDSNSSMQNVSTIAIICGTIGCIVILTLITILVLRFKRSKSDTQSSAPGHAANNIYLSERPDGTVNNSQASLSPGFHQLTQPTLNQDDSEYAVVNNPNNSIEDASSPRDDTIYENTDLNLSSHVAPQPSSASTNQDDSESRDDDMPVYETTEFDKSSPAASDSPVYSQVNKAPPVNSQVNKVPPVNSQVNDPPVYSQVNKSVKTDEAKKSINKDKSLLRQSSGFVDNILYISSGPANADDIAYSREDDTNIYKSTDIDTSQDVSSPAAPHPPIYSEVKRAKTGTDDVGQDSHRESSGFVDNMIYVSSGPSNTDDD